MSNSLRCGFYSGLIAGIAGGAWIFIYVFYTQNLALLPEVATLDFWIDYMVYHVGIVGIFGGIFGLVYSKFYAGIPGKGVIKGLVFGLMMGILANIGYSTEQFLIWSLTGIELAFQLGVGWIIGFQKWIVYCIVLGVLYERLKL